MSEKKQMDTDSTKIPEQKKLPEKIPSKNLKILISLSLIIVILLALIVSVFLMSNRKECPETCDDFDNCTIDMCSEETKFKCIYKTITPCDGNEICEMGEYEISTDCPNCDDFDNCTIDSFDYQNQKCENKTVILPSNTDASNDYISYVKYFTENLISGKKDILKCFFESKLSDEEISQFVDFSKDFSEYSFTITSSDLSLGKVQCKVLDPDFKSHDIFIYIRKIGEHWYIAKIEDKDEILKSTNKTTSWQTYESKKYGFEFQYPEEFDIASDSDEEHIAISEGKEGHGIYYVKIENNPDNLTLEEILEKEVLMKNKSVNDILIDGKPAKKYSIKKGLESDYGNAGVILIIDNNILFIRGDDSVKTKNIDFELFISTFKFAK